MASCSFPLSTSYFLLKGRFEYVESYQDRQRVFDKPDLLLVTTRRNCQKALNGKLLHMVARKGVPLLYVIEVSNGSPEGSRKVPVRVR